MDERMLLQMHEAMVMSRTIEAFCMDTSPHWYAGVGEEATVVGTFSQLGARDVAVPHYRGSMVIPWMRGAPLSEILGRVIPRRTSPMKGRLYGQFSGDVTRGVLPYVTLALGPNLAVAVGAALAARHKGQDHVAVCSFGDGTTGTGDFHESLNLAATLGAPVVFVCQNNQIAISTRSRDALAAGSVTQWARGYGLPCFNVDGNDVTAVATAVRTAIDITRVNHRPTMVEASTYRMGGHFRADPAAYQDPKEKESWQGRDPILLLEGRLESEFALAASALRAVWNDCEKAVRNAAESVEGEPPLSADDLGISEVYAHAH